MPWISLLVIVPFVAAIALAFVPRGNRAAGRTIGIAGALLTLLVLPDPGFRAPVPARHPALKRNRPAKRSGSLGGPEFLPRN